MAANRCLNVIVLAKQIFPALAGIFRVSKSLVITPPMKRFFSRFLLAATLGLAALPAARAQQPPAPALPTLPPRAQPPKIVLKLDDMVGPHANWQAVLDEVNKRQIKAGFGIICNSLENPKPGYLDFIKKAQASGRIEFWCHGYDHKQWVENGLTMWEFYGPSVAQQKEHLAKCQTLARAKLGAPFASFGAPFNQTDEKFAEVMRDDPDFKVWMYGDGQFPMGKVVETRVGDVNIENPLFRPSTLRLAQGMAHHPTQAYFVIQGHPPQWDAPRVAEFVKMLDFLTAQHAVFMTPSELAATLPPPGPAGPLPPPSKQIPAPAAPAAATGALPLGKAIGDNLVTNGDFSQEETGWRLDRMEGIQADDKVEPVEGGKHALHVTVPTEAEKRYYVQLMETKGFPMAADKTYTLSFRARSKPELETIVMVNGETGAGEMGRQDHIQLSQDWKDYQFTIAPKHAADAARICISGLAAKAGEYWLTDISVKQNQ